MAMQLLFGTFMHGTVLPRGLVLLRGMRGCWGLRQRRYRLLPLLVVVVVGEKGRRRLEMGLVL